MTAKLRRLLAEPGLVMAPGVADALYARLVAKAGYPAIYMTGSGTTATRLGMPDVGLLTMTEMVDNAERIADTSVALPVGPHLEGDDVDTVVAAMKESIQEVLST